MNADPAWDDGQIVDFELFLGDLPIPQKYLSEEDRDDIMRQVIDRERRDRERDENERDWPQFR